MRDECGYENPPDMSSLLATAVVAAICAMFSLITIMSHWKGSASSIIMIGSFAILCIGFYRELIIRPKVVTVTDGGVHLEYRIRKPLFIPWHGIEWVDSVPADKGTLKGKDTVEGRMKIRVKYWPMQLTYEAAHAIREMYSERVGNCPPISSSLAQRRAYEATLSTRI